MGYSLVANGITTDPAMHATPESVALPQQGEPSPHVREASRVKGVPVAGEM